MKKEKQHPDLKKCEIGIFDLDGTVVNSRKLVRFFGIRLASKFFSIAPDKATYSSLGVPISSSLKKIGAKLGVKSILEPINSISHKLQQNGTPIEGAKKLKKLDQTLYCSTTSPKKAAETRLENNDLLDSFADIFTREDGPKIKHLHKIAQMNSLSLDQLRERAFLVSDDPSDLNLCHNENLRLCIGINSSLDNRKLKKAGADWTISSLKELKSG